MQKTTNYTLNQWEASDPIRREDFNRDNAVIDAALENLNGRIYFGSWVGDGTKNRTIQLPFEPRFILVMGHYYDGDARGLLVFSTQDCQRYVVSGSCAIGSADWGGALSGAAFQMGAYPSWNNYSGETVYYLAIQ